MDVGGVLGIGFRAIPVNSRRSCMLQFTPKGVLYLMNVQYIQSHVLERKGEKVGIHENVNGKRSLYELNSCLSNPSTLGFRRGWWWHLAATGVTSCTRFESICRRKVIFQY